MLTKEQQELIENSLWVVNTALKNQGLQADEDLRQSALLYMCQCVERFDPSKGIMWTTFAYRNVYLFIKRANAKKVVKDFPIIFGDVPYLGEEDVALDNAFNLADIQRIRNVCSEEENWLIDLKLSGYKYAEIGEFMDCSTRKVVFMMNRIKQKVQKMIETCLGEK